MDSRGQAVVFRNCFAEEPQNIALESQDIKAQAFLFSELMTGAI